MAFYNKDINQILKELNSTKNGLSSSQAKSNIERFGKNELDKPKKVTFFKRLLAQFKNIMIIILLVSAMISIISAITTSSKENLFEGALILVIVFINAIVGVIQEQKAENALEALISKTEPFANTYRDGVLQKINIHELAVGDIVELKTGDIVPADIRLISCSNLKTDESSLTGESHPVSKQAETISKQNVELASQTNMCFSGTTITSGHAKGIVVSTGRNSEIGKIAKILSTEIKEKTPLEKNIDKIGKVLTYLVLAVALVVFLVQLFTNKNLNIMDSFLIAVALAVAAIPESLPAVITIIMALGVQKLAKQNAIIKKLSAVETLGSCNVICSDKTGTLTKNQMTVWHIFANKKIYNANEFNISNSAKIFEIAALCNNALINDTNNITADATETALVNFLHSKNISVKQLKETHKRLKENEFNSKTKMMSVICENQNSNTLYAKGALDYIISKCNKILIDNTELELSEKLKTSILKANQTLCENGERVIAFAYKNNVTSKNSRESDENNLIFAGFAGIIDPPRPEAIRSIELCKKAGLKTIMITGDHPATAFAIAKTLKIAKSEKQVMSGQELNKLTDNELSKIIKHYSVFARVTPEHKLKIVKALKANGNIVAMTGDGVNDAPSIKTANIGACMGITGTDVTKEVSDIIISDDNFSSLVVAIKEGRTIYQNISKTILFLLSTNIVEVLGIFITSLVIPGSVFLLPVQILFINLVTDSLPAFALGIEPAEPNIMNKPPREPNKSLLSGNIGLSIIYQGFIQTLIVLVMFVCARNFYSDAVATTMSFLTICLMQIIHAINCKSEKSIFKINIFKNKMFNFSFLILFALILAVYFIPFFANIFELVTLTGLQWLIIFATSLSIIPLVELGKLFIK